MLIYVSVSSAVPVPKEVSSLFVVHPGLTHISKPGKSFLFLSMELKYAFKPDRRNLKIQHTQGQFWWSEDPCTCPICDVHVKIVQIFGPCKFRSNRMKYPQQKQGQRKAFISAFIKLWMYTEHAGSFSTLDNQFPVQVNCKVNYNLVHCKLSFLISLSCMASYSARSWATRFHKFFSRGTSHDHTVSSITMRRVLTGKHTVKDQLIDLLIN